MRSTALVTGGATGIGAAAVTALAGRGDRVFLLDIDDALGLEVAERHVDVEFVHCDLTSEESVKAAMTKIGGHTEHLDYLVNNAGGFGVVQGIEETTLDEWRHVIDANLTSIFLMT
ncbi:MAG TPA: SDR family oxidoreductase, partial [Acidimicrobiia bacterium]